MAKMGILYDKDIKERVFALFSEMVSSPTSITFEGTNVVTNGVSTRILATLRDGLTLFSGEKLTYEVKHGSTVLDSGTETTDNNGQISINYTGTALGKIDVIVKYRTLLQETSEVLDAIFYDDTTTDNSSRYYINSTYTTINYSNNWYNLILGSSAQYTDLRNIVDSVKSKTVNVEVDVELPANVRARLRTQALSPNVAGEYVTGTATAKLENVEIPSDETDMYFRFEFADASSGDIIKFKNWKIYSA